MRLLIVDDCEDNCEVLGELLRCGEHEVDCALSAQQALHLVSQNRYDCIVLDIRMPDLDGYALARRIRQSCLFRASPRLIALTGLSFDPHHPYASEAAFDAYLMKPADIDTLLAAVNHGQQEFTLIQHQK